MRKNTDPEHGAPRPTDRSTDQDPVQTPEKGHENTGPGTIADSDAPAHSEPEDDTES